MGNGIAINCIGVGHWGPNLVRALTTHPDARVGMVCDISEDRLKLIRQKIPSVGGFTTDSNAALTDPKADAVVIATPAKTHFALAKTALEAGKHVLVEKPICLTSTEATELIGIAEERKRILAVGHVFLFNNAVRGLRNIIRSGELGPVKYIYSTRCWPI